MVFVFLGFGWFVLFVFLVKGSFKRTNQAFSDFFANDPNQSEILEIFGNRICRSPRRGLIGKKFGSSSVVNYKRTLNKHVQGNRHLSMTLASSIVITTGRATKLWQIG